MFEITTVVRKIHWTKNVWQMSSNFIARWEKLKSFDFRSTYRRKLLTETQTSPEAKALVYWGYTSLRTTRLYESSSRAKESKYKQCSWPWRRLCFKV